MPATSIVNVGLLLLVLLIVIAVEFRSGPIEQDLIERTSAALKQHGLESITVTLDGRDVTLHGMASKQVAKDALALVSNPAVVSRKTGRGGTPRRLIAAR